MTRSESSFFRNPFRQPWWFWVAVAVMVFSNFRYFLPAIAGEALQHHPTVGLLSEYAHWIAVPFLLPLIFLLWKRIKRQ